MQKETILISIMPITVQAGLRFRKLALQSEHSIDYVPHSRAASTKANPAPVPAILATNTGWEKNNG